MSRRERNAAREVTTTRRSIVKIGATLGALGVTGLAGCVGDDGDSEENDSDITSPDIEPDEITRGGTFRVGAEEGVQTISPFEGFRADYILSEVMYDRLTRVNRELEAEPNLAEEWDHNDEFTEWTFSLDEDATFANHDGEPVTAEDVKATYEYLTSDDFAGAIESISDVQSVSVIDEQTVDIVLESPDVSFPRRIAETGGVFFIAPKTVLEDDPSRLEDTDYGSGPLTLADWDVQNRLVFEANTEYHVEGIDDDPLPYVDELEWEILSDPIQRANSLADGNIDAIHRTPATVVDRLQDDSQVVTQPSGQQFPIILNTTVEPFDDELVRRAIKHAMDRSEFVAGVQGDGILGHHSAVTPVNVHYNDELPEGDTFGTTAQPDEARDLLSEAGYEDGFEVKPLHYGDAFPQRETIAQLFQQQMAEVGIEFEINQLTEETWLSDYWNQDGVWYIGDYGTRVLGSTIPRLALRSEGPWNEANWSNDEYDEAYHAAANATDPETLAENLKECQRINHRQGAWVGTYHPTLYAAHKDYVQNYRPYPTHHKDYVSEAAVDE